MKKIKFKVNQSTIAVSAVCLVATLCTIKALYVVTDFSLSLLTYNSILAVMMIASFTYPFISVDKKLDEE